MRAYLRSPYASQFADAFVAGVVTLNAAIDREAVVDIAALMEPEQEKVIYLRIARRAAIDGLIDLAAFAASRAEGVEDDPRAELYSSLSSVTSGTVEDVLDKLSKIDRGRLSENDRQLLDAASAIAAEMTVAPAGLTPVDSKPADPRPATLRPSPNKSAPSVLWSWQADPNCRRWIKGRRRIRRAGIRTGFARRPQSRSEQER